ncbi:unnamed protein product [Closterium sp. NIES-54]
MEVVEVAAAVVLVEVHPRSVEALVVASASSSRVPVRPRRPSSFVSGTLGVGGMGLPRWGDLLRQNVAIFDLDFDAILAAMYAFADSAEGDCYLSVPPDPGIEAAALGARASAAPGTDESAAPGAGESALYGTAPTEALHTFTLDYGASRSFFRDSTTLTSLSRPVAVSLADPSGAQSLRTLPQFYRDAWVDQFTPGGQRVTHCTCSRTGRHLATFTRRPGSSLYTLTTAPPPVSASGQVAASSQVFAAASRSSPESTPCSCRPLSHETLLWTHLLGHPSLPRLRAFVHDTSADKLSSRAVPCVFLGFPSAAPGWQLYNPTSRRVLSSQDVTFDESVSYYRLFSLPHCLSPLFLAPGTPPVDPLPPHGPAPSGVSHVDPAEAVEVAVDSGAGRGAEPVGAGTEGAERGVAESKGAEPGGAEPGGAESGSAETGGAEPELAATGGPPGAAGAAGAAGAGGAAGAAGGAAGAGAAGGASRAAGGAAGAGVPGGATGGTGAVGGPAGVGAAGGAGAAGHGGARTGGTGAAGAGGAAGVGAAGARAVATRGASGAGATGGTAAGGATGVVTSDPGAEGTGAVFAVSGGAARPRPYYVPLLQQVLGLLPSPGPTPPLQSPPPVQSQSQLLRTSPLPGPSPYSGPSRGLTECREPESHPVSPESRPA